MSNLRSGLSDAVGIIGDYRESLTGAPVAPTASRADVRGSLPETIPDEGAPVQTVIDELVQAAVPGLMASAGPRYFGFVVGGSTDASLVADLLATGWDQVAFNEALSPAAMGFEDVAGGWLKDLLGIPKSASVGFVTGGQAANNVGLATARWQVLRQHGWDVGVDGLSGAPPIRVLAGEERHATIDRAVRLLGLGERSIVAVPAKSDGAMDAAALRVALADGTGPTIVCAQSGNVNTGAFDDLRTITDAARELEAWVHVDGAFGLWAAASPKMRYLVDGIEQADSWACDGHKWLNVPYDSGFAFCKHPDVHATALAYTAAYLTGQVAGREFGGGDFVPESSRRARGFAVWAGLRGMGRSGVAELIERCCALARELAAGLGSIEGVEVVNEVVLNQVLVRVGDEAVTNEVESWIQREGTVWLGSTMWRGERLLRVSVSNWSTTETDIEMTIDVIRRARETVVGQ